MWERLREQVRYGWLHPRYLAQRELRNFVASEGRVALHGKLLDIGCGNRPYTKYLPNVMCYTGVDMPGSMHGPKHADVLASALALPFADASFDSLLCTEVLEHLRDPVAALREMARVARPGARLLLTVPLSEQLHEEPEDYCRFTCHWLRHLLSSNGWKPDKVEPRGGAWLEIGYRLSSLLYSTFGATREANGRLKPRALLGPPIILLCSAVQITSSAVDALIPNPLSTIGYGVIATRM